MGVVTEGPVGSLAPIITLAAAEAGLGCVGGPGQEKHDVDSPDPLRPLGISELSDQKLPTAKESNKDLRKMFSPFNV